MVTFTFPGFASMMSTFVADATQSTAASASTKTRGMDIARSWDGVIGVNG